MTQQRLIVGCGYLGRRVADLWRDRGDHVTVLTRSVERAAELRANGFHPVVGDVLDAASLSQLPQVETVLYAVGFDRSAGGDFRTVTVEGLRNFLHSPAGQSLRMIAISSTSVYGQANGEQVEETSPTEPSRPNGAACLEAEQLLERMRNEFDQQAGHSLVTVILRLAGIYGPGRLLRRKEQLARQEPLPGPAEAWLNLIHVDDAARAACAAAEHPQPSPLYLVADDAPVQRMIYYWALSSLTDTPPPVFDDAAARSGRPSPRAPGLNKRCVNSLLRQELLPELRYPSFNEGLPQAISETGE